MAHEPLSTPVKPPAPPGGMFFDSPALSTSKSAAAAGREMPSGTPQGGTSERRGRRGHGRKKEGEGRQGLDASATSEVPLKPSGSGRSVFDSPVTLPKRSQPSTPSGAKRQDPASSLKPNGRSVFEVPGPLASTKPDAPRKKSAPRKKTKGPKGAVVATSSDQVAVSPEDEAESWYRSATLEDVLDELSSRFIACLSEEELASPERTCFQIEQAHWFYEDFIRDAAPSLPPFRLRSFCKRFMSHSPLLKSRWGSDAEGELAFERFVAYKKRVPVCGIIMLNESWTKTVLVKGWKANSSWGWPKGKMNNDEPKHLCAIREVEEETGYNCGNLLNKEDYIHLSLGEQEVTLFVVPGVPEDTVFEPLARKEISAIDWFDLNELPAWRRRRRNARAVKYFMITPFVPYLKEWIHNSSPTTLVESSSETDEAAEDTVHVDSESNIKKTDGTDIAYQESLMHEQPITSHINGQPSVIDDLFSKFTIASEKKEAADGARARQLMEESKADPAMQVILQKLMSHGRKDVNADADKATPVQERSSSADSTLGKQQALMNKLMSSLGATPVMSPAPVSTLGDPSTPSKQSAVLFNTDLDPPVHHPYSAVNDGGFPVPTHNPALAALNGHVHPAFPPSQFTGPPHPPSPHFEHAQQPHGMSHLTANLLNVLTPPRPASTVNTAYPNHYNQPSAGNSSVSNPMLGTYMPTNGYGQNGPPASPAGPQANPQNPLLSILSPQQSNMQPAQTQPQSNQFSHLPGPIQLPLQPGMAELNRILPYQALPIRSMEAEMGQVMHHQPPLQFQQMHPTQALSPPRHPASTAQAHQLLSLLNPKEHVPVKSPSMSSAKTADGLLALLVGNNQQGAGS
ncbi:hypothetical protein NliqN6_5200 [Naganishia liquefaciens]|uniref:Nudix hydrolase domain-containing protein n=1 Tax=Naganishia liquefaciens TaxID=104408 RepID=A0A8H3TXB0_9TREE|nr:hypothetical protein NliqN6_5200 [Naganishia liquefaciens]